VPGVRDLRLQVPADGLAVPARLRRSTGPRPEHPGAASSITLYHGQLDDPAIDGSRPYEKILSRRGPLVPPEWPQSIRIFGAFRPHLRFRHPLTVCEQVFQEPALTCILRTLSVG
jgi:hypothetical protein